MAKGDAQASPFCFLSAGMKRCAILGFILLVCALLLGLVGWRDYHTWFAPARTASFSFHPTPNTALEPLPFLPLEGDSFYWLALADVAATGGLTRTHWTFVDNPPEGRAVYWASLLPWTIAAVTHFVSAILPMDNVREFSAFLVPLVLWFALLALSLPFFLRISGVAGVVAGLSGLLFLPGLQRDFGALRLDHHGASDGAILLCIAALAAAMASEKLRRLVLVSAVAGAFAFWIQAPVSAVVINAAGIAAAFHIWAIYDRRRGAPPIDAATWQLWGRVGGAITLGLYVLEYAPHYLGMRLEVNHPVYAINWWALGEGLAWLTKRESADARPPRVFGILSLLGIALLPALLVFGPVEWFLFRDAFLVRVHGVIAEFLPMRALFASSWLGLLSALGPGLLAIPVAVVFIVRARLSERHLLALALTLASAVIALSLAWQHNRFIGLANAMLTLLLVVVLAHVPVGARRNSAASLALILALIPAATLFLHLGRLEATGQPRSGFVARVQQRDLALRLAQLVPPHERTVLTGFDEAPVLSAMAGFQTTGALYWENREGLRKTVLFFTAEDDDAAHDILLKNEIRCVVLDASPQILEKLYYCRHGEVSKHGIEKTMAFRLATGQQVPHWLEPLPLDLVPVRDAGHFVAYRVVADAASSR